jgi:RNA exonuclease 1
MFSTLGLFRQIPCPTTRCIRINCPFSHEPIKQSSLPADELDSLTARQDPTESSQPTSVTPAKRTGSPITDVNSTRPAKLLRPDPDNPPMAKTANSSRLAASSGASGSTSTNTNKAMSHSDQGPPKLVVNPANSKVPLNVRQAMLTALYGAFKDLYHQFHSSRPEVAYQDALLQEEEIHAKTNKTTYRNVRRPRLLLSVW